MEEEWEEMGKGRRDWRRQVRWEGTEKEERRGKGREGD